MDQSTPSSPAVPQQRFGNPGLPRYVVPRSPFVSIEHPFIVNNIERAIKFLGGEKRVIKSLKACQDPESKIGLLLQPDDPLCRPIPSTHVRTGDVLIRISFPARTGRKRKRGSGDPWVESALEELPEQNGLLPESQPSTAVASNIPKKLRDNVGQISIVPIGVVEQTYRFQELSDFQYSTCEDPLVRKVEQSILDLDVEKLKTFELGKDPDSLGDTSLVPPPHFTQINIPFIYGYHQNHSVALNIDTNGQPFMVNMQQPQKLYTIRVRYDVAEVPEGPDPYTPELSEQDKEVQSTVRDIQQLMKDRPIWTRRALFNRLNYRDRFFKIPVQYVGYMFLSGPWKDSIIKYGLDPRKDPKYSIYQTLIFQLVDNQGKPIKATNGAISRNRSSHLFDGLTVAGDGRVWQICDVTDNLLTQMLSGTRLKNVCDIQHDGWYENGLMAKLKTIMRQKIRTIIDGAKPDDFDYTKVIEIPDNVDRLATYGRFLNFPRFNNRDVRRSIWNASASASESIDRDLESPRETAPRAQKRRNTANSQAQQDQRVAEVMLELQRRARDSGVDDSDAAEDQGEDAESSNELDDEQNSLERGEDGEEDSMDNSEYGEDVE